MIQPLIRFTTNPHRKTWLSSNFDKLSSTHRFAISKCTFHTKPFNLRFCNTITISEIRFWQTTTRTYEQSFSSWQCQYSLHIFRHCGYINSTNGKCLHNMHNTYNVNRFLTSEEHTRRMDDQRTLVQRRGGRECADLCRPFTVTLRGRYPRLSRSPTLGIRPSPSSLCPRH